MFLMFLVSLQKKLKCEQVSVCVTLVNYLCSVFFHNMHFQTSEPHISSWIQLMTCIRSKRTCTIFFPSKRTSTIFQHWQVTMLVWTSLDSSITFSCPLHLILGGNGAAVRWILVHAAHPKLQPSKVSINQFFCLQEIQSKSFSSDFPDTN